MRGRRTRGLHKTGRTGIASQWQLTAPAVKVTHPPHLSLITCHFIDSRDGALWAILSWPILWLQRARRQGLEGGLWVPPWRAPLKAKKKKNYRALYLWVQTMQANTITSIPREPSDINAWWQMHIHNNHMLNYAWTVNIELCKVPYHYSDIPYAENFHMVQIFAFFAACWWTRK